MLVKLVQRGYDIAGFARIRDEIQWPLAKDEAVVKLDECHHFFSLQLEVKLVYCKELDKHLDKYSYFSVQKIAERQAVVNPENTFFSVKRFIGRKMSEVDEESKQVSYRVVRDENGNVKLDCPAISKQFVVEEIFAQRTTTKDTGRIAGLEVMRILYEPTATSLAYGFERKKIETILVFDLRGGHLMSQKVWEQEKIGWDENCKGYVLFGLPSSQRGVGCLGLKVKDETLKLSPGASEIVGQDQKQQRFHVTNT
eukprot:Gb_14735 [translate_table: standard]